MEIIGLIVINEVDFTLSETHITPGISIQKSWCSIDSETQLFYKIRLYSFIRFFMNRGDSSRSPPGPV